VTKWSKRAIVAEYFHFCSHGPVLGDIAESLRVRVTAVNGAGASSAANSLGTTTIIAA
jgi:hypothetical protein